MGMISIKTQPTSADSHQHNTASLRRCDQCARPVRERLNIEPSQPEDSNAGDDVVDRIFGDTLPMGLSSSLRDIGNHVRRQQQEPSQHWQNAPRITGTGGFPRPHSSPDLPRRYRELYSSSVCVRERSIAVEELRSPNGRFRFVMQPDCTLVLFMGDDDIWAIYLASRPREAGTIFLILQNDGNLVAVDSSFRPVWESHTANEAPGPYTLTMQNDGNCVLYAAGGVYLWATRTAGWG